jgi:hypothetical protein
VADVLQMGWWKVRSRARLAIAIPVIATSAFVLTPGVARAALARADGGYRVSDSTGTVLAFGSKHVASSFLAQPNGQVVGMASTRSGRGYWLAGEDGGVFAYGDANFYGSITRGPVHAPITGIAATPSGRGYWLAARDGGVFAFGDARYYGSAVHGRMRAPVTGIAETRSGHGYWLVGADGGVFAFGDARYYGSAARGSMRALVVGIAATPSGRGYWLAGSDGGVFAYGDARFLGSGAQRRFNVPVSGIAATPSGRGYWLVGTDGGVFAYGDAKFHGSPLLQSARVAAQGTRGVYRHGSTGYDISWPQCGAPYPDSPHDIAVVGINNGHMYSENPCLASQAAWAGSSLTLYVNVDGLPNDATSGMTGPRGSCAVTDLVCRSYNYGRSGVEYDLAYTKRLGIDSPMWWLDVEVEPIWRNDPVSNANVIQGVLDGLRLHGRPAGIYSTNYQWGVITGGAYNPRTPTWVAGPNNLEEAKAYCAPRYGFGGGPTWLTQWSTHFDHSYAC